MWYENSATGENNHEWHTPTGSKKTGLAQAGHFGLAKHAGISNSSQIYRKKTSREKATI